jgi:hypothetical protein
VIGVRNLVAQPDQQLVVQIERVLDYAVRIVVGCPLL